MKRMLKNKFILCLCLGMLAWNVDAAAAWQNKYANDMKEWIDKHYKDIYSYLKMRGYLGYIEDQHGRFINRPIAKRILK